MQYLENADIYYLEHKYHHPDAPFNPFRRYFYHGVDYPDNGLDDGQMEQKLKERFVQVADLPHPVAKAKCFAFVLENMRIDVSPHDYFVGLYNWGRPLRFIMEEWKAEAFRGQERYGQLVKQYTASGTCALWPDFDHVIPDWGSLLTLGFPGLTRRAEAFRNRALTPEQDAFLEGVVLAYRAVEGLLARLAAWAETHEAKAGVAQSLRNLCAGAPQTTLDALQAIYLFFMLCEHVDNYQTRSLGNGLDETLRPFLERDLAKGIPQQQLETWIAYFLKQFDAIGNYWGHPLYLGGTDKAGNCLVSHASYTILRVHEALGLYNPKIQLKVSRDTPKDFLHMAFRRIRDGGGSFVFCCEPAYRAAVRSYGATEEEAVTCEISGCYETRVRGNESSTVVGYVNALKPVLLALRGGFDLDSGAQLGPETDKAPATFEAFLQSYLTHWALIMDNAMEIGTNMYDPALAVVNPSLMYSGTVVGALEKAVDGYAYGCKYNNSSLLNCGFASAVDALMAVKTLVYDQKAVTLQDLEQALAQNWEGAEALRARALACPHKYGNADPETDKLAKRLSDFFTDRVNGRPNGRGGVYKAMLHSARMFVVQGSKLGATPDGRKAGQEESKNASPSVGMDRRGVTALIRSALSLDMAKYPESSCLDLMLHPSAVEGEAGLEVMTSLLYTFMDGGGMALQFNVFSAETLRDAQENPEKYRNLQVRVCGWNVLWNNMSRDEQNAYIRRAEAIC